jgi:hypothetical protein
VFQTKINAPNAMECPSKLKKHINSKILKSFDACRDTCLESQSTTRASIHTRSNAMFNEHGISTQVNQPLIQIDQISIYQCITWLKPSKRETFHDPNQCGHFMQYINAKGKKITYEFLTITH